MKINIKLSMVAAALMMATSAQAGIAGLNLGLGGGQYNSDTPSGSYDDGLSATPFDLVNNLGVKGQSNTYAWGYVEHPLPIIPNIRLEMNNDKYVGNVGFNETFLGETFGGQADTVVDLSANDLILYWGLPLTGMMSTVTPLVSYDIDFGAGVKQFNGSVSVTNTLVPTQAVEKTIEEIMPYGYARARVEAFGVGLEGQIKYVKYEANEFMDTTIKVDYTFPITPVIDIGVEAGIKSTDLVIDYSSLKADLSTKGVFFGGFLKF